MIRKIKEREYLKGHKEVENSVALQIIEESLKEGVPVKLTVMGNSMFPTLLGGKDVVTLVPFTREQSLTVGDVVLFRYKKAFLLHRVIEIPHREEGQPVFLKGDAVTSVEKIHISDILAIAHFKRRSPALLFWRRISAPCQGLWTL